MEGGGSARDGERACPCVKRRASKDESKLDGMEGEGRGWEHGFAIYRGLIGQTVKASREGERSPMAGTDELDVKIRIASRSVAAELIDMAWLPKSLILSVATHL